MVMEQFESKSLVPILPHLIGENARANVDK